MIAIIYVHPWSGSFNKAILDAITSKLDNEKREYTVIDLHADEFNPVLTVESLALYSKGESADPLVKKYQDIIKSAKEVFFIFPIWWGSMPAMLKGFLDKTLLVNFSHNYENGWTPLLDIDRTLVITTSESTSAKFSNAMEIELIQNNLQFVGFNNGQWINCEHASHGSKEHREEFITNMLKEI